MILKKTDCITFSMCESHGELILKALELYGLNLHYFVKKGTDEYYLSNMDLLHTYNEVLSSVSSFRSSYNLIDNCNREISYFHKNKFKKFSA